MFKKFININFSQIESKNIILRLRRCIGHRMNNHCDHFAVKEFLSH